MHPGVVQSAEEAAAVDVVHPHEQQEESEQQSSEEETFTVMINVWRTSIKGGERTTV